LLTVTCSSTIHTECIVVFPLQQWLSERATMLRYTYIPYRVLFSRLYSTFLIIIFRMYTFFDLVSNFQRGDGNSTAH